MAENEQQEPIEESNDTDKKEVIPVIVTVIVVIVGFFLFVMPVLQKTEHDPTFIIEKSTEEGYWKHVLE